MNPSLSGLHHVTAITADAQANIDFYCGVLGLRLVKLTVNFDDPTSYHLYYGDHLGRPGSIMTFFAWPGGYRGEIGPPQVTTTSFAAPAGSLDFWAARLKSHNVEARSGGQTARLLTEVMGFRAEASEGNRFRYRSDAGEGPSVVDIECVPDARRGNTGTGVVHHVAFRTPDDDQQQAWRRKLVQLEYDVSPIMDRTYFHSIYFREPGGVLFEIATDPPGFTVDETADRLGTRLQLPPPLEPHRAELELILPKLRLPG
ncbi:MAG: ring-cleaving dioxygenase [Chloroflexi bacterium]|nr:ring-cleaving dioxygenase [Chloroflexota bacterium]